MENLIEKELRFDLDANTKQKYFFNEIIKSVKGFSEKRYFFYGGVIRGGKTSICLFTLHHLACKYPKFRAYVICKDSVKAKLLKSYFEQLFGKSTFINNKKDGIINQMYYNNRSIIRFIGENFMEDKNFDRIKALEVNVIMLEEMEELQENTFNLSAKRMNTNPNLPGIGFILGTNGSEYDWIQEKEYSKYQNGLRPKDYLYVTALTSDNPFVFQDKIDVWIDSTGQENSYILDKIDNYKKYYDDLDFVSIKDISNNDYKSIDMFNIDNKQFVL